LAPYLLCFGEMGYAVICSRVHTLLNPAQCRILAEVLGESPETALVVHALMCGACRAYILGTLDRLQSAVIEIDGLPAEPHGFGSDAKLLWQLLKHVDGWDCVLVASEVAHELGSLIQTETGRSVRYYGDIGHVLATPVVFFSHPAVRPLNVRDLRLLESAPDELKGEGFQDQRALLSEGIVAGAVVDGRLVSRAHAYSQTGRYAEQSVHTLEGWRGRGFATAAASIVAQRVQREGRIPVWSAGEDNWASLRIAQKLGFRQTFRRCFVIRL
jgi:GNAT superfamily N-acetyltransferase